MVVVYARSATLFFLNEAIHLYQRDVMANVGNKFDNTRHAWNVEWDDAPNHGNSFQYSWMSRILVRSVKHLFSIKP